jgi:hypothetical protein
MVTVNGVERMSKMIREGTGDAPLGADLVWQCKGIAAELGLAERTVFHLVATGQLPVGRLGGRIFASRAALKAHLNAALVASREA